MSRDPGEDLRTVVALVLGGMAVPAVLVLTARTPTELPLSGQGLVLAGATTFGLVSFLLIDLRDLDGVNLLMASIVLPWPTLLAGVQIVLLLTPGQPVPTGPAGAVLDLLIGSVSDFFVYGAAYGVTGAGAFGLATLLRRRRSTGAASREDGGPYD